MFRLSRRRRPDPPAVAHVHLYTARFLCTLEWHYNLVRASLRRACELPPAMACITASEWRGHAATVTLTLVVPWSLPAEARVAQADAYVSALIESTTVATWLLHIQRDGHPVPSADWSAVADHRDLAELAAHCRTFYDTEDRDDGG